MSNAASYVLKHSHSSTVEVFDSYEEALAAVRDVFADAEVGHAGDISEGGERTLVWASAADAENDDGSRAVASISVRHVL